MTTATLFNQSLAPASTGCRRTCAARGQAHRHRRRRHCRVDDRADPRALASSRAASRSRCSSPRRWAPSGWGRARRPGCAASSTAWGSRKPEWMPACHATYKCGITFAGWSTKPGFERYFHPFASMLDNLTMHQFVHNAGCAHQRRMTCMRTRTDSSSPHAWRPGGWRRSRPRTSPSTSGTAITSMRCCSGSSCSARPSSAACATRAAT